MTLYVTVYGRRKKSQKKVESSYAPLDSTFFWDFLRAKKAGKALGHATLLPKP
jgi:hypothetical protein